MEALLKANNTVRKADLRDQLDLVLEQVQAGKKILITDNGHSLAEMIPVAHGQTQFVKRSERMLETKEEFLAEIARIEAAYLAGEISVQDSYLSCAEPVDMGPTTSSNLDLESYK